MKYEEKTAVEVLFEADRYGQKNNKGFYAYAPDKKGRIQRQPDPDVDALIKSVQQEDPTDYDEEVIIERMMLPLCIETVRCLEDGIVNTAAEADMGLIFGIGFPPFRGGALRYIDSMGLDNFCAMADKYADLGPLYHPTDGLREMAKAGKKFFG